MKRPRLPMSGTGISRPEIIDVKYNYHTFIRLKNYYITRNAICRQFSHIASGEKNMLIAYFVVKNK